MAQRTRTEMPIAPAATEAYAVQAQDVRQDAMATAGGGLACAREHILLGDCLDVLDALPEGCVDLVHTSPPYNIGKTYRGKYQDSSEHEAYLSFLREVIAHLRRVLKPRGSIFWQTGYTQTDPRRGILPLDHLTHPYFLEEPDALVLWDRIIWRYFGGPAFKNKFTNRHETILWYVKPSGDRVDPILDVDEVRETTRNTDPRNNFWGRNPGNVWDVERVAYGSNSATSHIAVFPEEVSEKIIRAAAPAGRETIVLDPFCGSGTAPKMARALGRSWIGIELVEEYVREAAERIGRTQPSEAESLLSSLLKKYGFDDRTGHAVATARLARELARWCETLNLPVYEDEFLSIVKPVFPEGFGGQQDKSAKAEAWRSFDEVFAREASRHRVVEADALLLRLYAQRKRQTTAHRYRSALRVLHELCSLWQRSDAEGVVRRLIRQEPSSYRETAEAITLTDTSHTGGLDEAVREGDQPLTLEL